MKIVFFDGYCSLCNALVDWLIWIDKNRELKFASLQGRTASQLLGHGLNPVDVSTVVYLRDDKRFEQSTALLRIFLDIGGVWSLARVFFIVPKPLRDYIYELVAKNRYRLMKKRETCRMPTPDERNRLLP